MNEAVRTSRTGTLGRITLARPERRNPLDSLTSAGILEGLRRHFSDDAVRSVVIDAEGDAFCAGADLDQINDLPTVSSFEAYEWPRDIVAAHELMLDAPKPVMAAVHGPAYAGGMGLAAMCDVVLATRAAKFATPEVKIGLFPMIIVGQLERSLPRKVLLEMMFTGEPLLAEDAHRLGFVNALADDRDGLEDLVATYAERFARISPDATRLGRRAYTLLSDMSLPDALRSAQFFNVPFFLGPDFAEGSAAFLAKRRPNWTT